MEGRGIGTPVMSHEEDCDDDLLFQAQRVSFLSVFLCLSFLFLFFFFLFCISISIPNCLFVRLSASPSILILETKYSFLPIHWFKRIFSGNGPTV